MIKLTQERMQDVLAYMEDDLENCLYLYGDIVRYGLDHPNMTVWFSEKDGSITTVVMQYFTGSHVYSKHLDYDLEEVIEKLQEIGVDRISSQREIIEALYPTFQDDFIAEYGSVIQYAGFRKMRSPVPIEKATPEDAREIAAFLITHEMYAGYEKESLADQLADLISTGIGSSYIIRDNGKIVANSSVNLETDLFAVTGLTLVQEEFQQKLYGSFLESHMINHISEDGKNHYGMILEGKRLDGMVRMGNKIVANYGKLSRKM